MSPHVLQALLPAFLEVDVIEELDKVRVPTLVLHSRGDRFVPVSSGQYVADHVADARLVELDSSQHYLFFEHGDASVDEILAFMGLSGPKRVGRHELAAVWFSDIVGSTEQLRASGDSAWHHRLEPHDRLVDHHLLSYGGELVKRLGDGVLALFGSTQDAVRCAARFSSACARIGLPVRVGIHVGDVERRSDGDVLGLAVHTAQRVEAAASAGQILLTATACGALAGAGFDVVSAGLHDLKGVGACELYAVRNA
jgi:class 3 adenylate cyclase